MREAVGAVLENRPRLEGGTVLVNVIGLGPWSYAMLYLETANRFYCRSNSRVPVTRQKIDGEKKKAFDETLIESFCVGVQIIYTRCYSSHTVRYYYQPIKTGPSVVLSLYLDLSSPPRIFFIFLGNGGIALRSTSAAIL